MVKAFLTDWRAGLQRDLDRAAPLLPAAQVEPWLMRWGAASLLLLLMLYLLQGYHTAFLTLNGLSPLVPSLWWENLTALGDERLVFVVGLLFARRRPEIFWLLLLSALLGTLFTHSFKPLFATLRPPAVLEPGSFHLIGPGHRGDAFPSGHSLAATVFLGVWLWYVQSRWLRWLLVSGATLIALSRVMVGVHWPLDVAAGILGGCLVLWGAGLLSQRWRAGLTVPGHLLGVLVGVGYGVTLFWDDGGYHQAAPMLQLTTFAACLLLLYQYLVGPWLRWHDQQAPASTTEAVQTLPRDLLLMLSMQLLFLFWPQIDLFASGLFYRPGEGFFLAHYPLVRISYEVFADLHFYVFGLLLLLLFRAWLKGDSLRRLLFLVLVLVIGPGLLVNEVIKADSGRARPRTTQVFGGDLRFTPAFEHSDQCARNCSFVSGHAAMGFYPLVFAWLTRKRRWLAAGIALGSLVGLGRMAQGAHFLSDVVFAFWLTYFTSLLLARWILGVRGIAPDRPT
jgi:membrane-associated phospholipid phosphatase